MVNLNDIKAARAPDVLVQANDVIDVPYSAAAYSRLRPVLRSAGVHQLAPVSPAI